MLENQWSKHRDAHTAVCLMRQLILHPSSSVPRQFVQHLFLDPVEMLLLVCGGVLRLCLVFDDCF